jgi:hypothetical protein
MRANIDSANIVALIGRVTSTSGLPFDSSSARRKNSSIIGPRMKPSSMGAGSASIFRKM